MPAVVGEITAPGVAGYPPRKRWTRAEIEIYENSGVFDGQHYELIEGDLINKMGKKRPHFIAVACVFRRLLKVFEETLVFPETPIDVAPEDNPTSHPEPDALVLRRPMKEIATDYAQPSDLALLIEVADSTLRFDLTVKAGLYARAAIAEYWVLDLSARRLIVHREAREGTYQSVAAYDATERVAPLAAPGREIPVADFFE